MNKQLTINTSSGRISAFLQGGFYSTEPPANVLHKHNYSEIHIIAGGKSRYLVGNRQYTFESSCVLIIPGGVFHTCFEADKKCLHSAFQIDLDVSDFDYITPETSTLLEFFRLLEECKITENHLMISSYINLFCSYFNKSGHVDTLSITDYGFLIHEFFTQNYAFDIHLCDLAEFIHLSCRQTERLVIRHTGNSFRDQLCQVRVTMAKELLKTTDMTLGEICQYVGYRSYAGFWKAMKKYDGSCP